MKSVSILTLILLVLSGCSIVPYEDEFACNLPDQLGKCQNMQDSYKEAVTGESINPPMKPASEQNESEQTSAQTELATDDALLNEAVPQGAYDRYIENYYDELQRLVVQPKNPVIRQPTQVRMLVLPYGSRDGSVMYMNRHIYWVHKQPQFIMGDYLKKPAEILESPMLHDTRNQ